MAITKDPELSALNNLICGVVATLIFLVFCFYFYLSSQNEIVGMVADDAIYLLMTDYFSPYYRTLSNSAAFVMQTSQFPPLYPFLLSIVGASSQKIIWAQIITTFFLLGASFVFYYWMRSEKVNKSTSLCLVFIFVISPVSFLMNIDLWSEHLYLLITFCSFYFLNKASSNHKYQLIACLFISLIPLVRFIGISLIIAYCFYLYLNRVKDKYKYILISFLPFIIWKIISIIFFQTDIYQQTLSDFYEHDVWSHFKYLFSSQLFDLWQGWHECFDIRRNIFSGIVCGIVLLFSLITLFIRLIDKKIDSLYVLFYLLIVWIWPDDNHNMRFIFVVFPMLLYYAYLTFILMFKIKISIQLRAAINTASTLIILITFLPTNIYALNRFSINTEAGLEPFKATKYWLTVRNQKDAVNTIRIVDKMIGSYRMATVYIPESECVYTIHQEQFMFFARKLAFPPPLQKEIIDDDILNNLTRCNFIHVLHTTSHPQYPGGYPVKILKNNFNYLMSFRMRDELDSPVVAELLKLNQK